MAWKIIVYETARGEEVVEKFIKKLSHQTIAKITRGVDLLEKYGLNLGMPHSKKIGDDLYELRIRGREEIRFIYIFRGNRIYILHGFKKQSNKTPRKEISLSLKRCHRDMSHGSDNVLVEGN